jgi:hypothetical protein
MLVKIYDWFAEGFEAADFQEVRASLKEFA